MKDRIKELRKTLGLTQQEFADRLGISRGNIATYETREGLPGNSVVNLICREFNVYETWLRTGEGEMFLPKVDTALDRLAAEHNLTSADYLLVEKFLALKPDSRKIIIDYIREVAVAIMDGESAPVPAPADTGQPQDADSVGIRPMIQAAARSGGVTEIEEISPDEVSDGETVP